jgi:phosphohistidine swiveling domain-containing protein
MNNFTKNFTQLSKQDAHLAGGKGASLGEMTQAGIPVPPGFVVLAQTFEHFIKETDLIQEIDAALEKVDHKAIHTVDLASETIRTLIEKQEVPVDIATEIVEEFKKLNAEFVAVRSSATAEDGAEHAWAGQLDSFLNTTNETLLLNVKHCWASLFTPRAIFYRFEKGLNATSISVAVVVQKMVQSEVSGIAFSVHPVTEDRNQLIIEGGFGLGEAIVSGSVTPDSYVVEKEPRNILDINVSTQSRGLFKGVNGGNEWKEISEPQASSQVLTEAQIKELSELILLIEKHYGFPCDIEWAFEAGKFYIVQSRPITTLAPISTENTTSSSHTWNTPELAQFVPTEYHYLGLWKQDLFSGHFWHDCWVPELIEQLHLKAEEVGSFGFRGGHYLIKKSMLASFKEQIKEKILDKDEAFFKNVVSVANSIYLPAAEVGESIQNAEPTLENFQKFAQYAKKINFLWALGAGHFIEAAEELLQESVVKESFPADRVLDIIPKLITPLSARHEELTLLQKEVEGKTLDEIKSDSVLLEKLNDHVKRYRWIEIFNFIGQPLTLERLYEEVSHMKASHTEMPPLAIEIPTELRWRAECLSNCGYVKQTGAEYFNIYSEKVIPFLQKVASAIGVTYSEMMSLNVFEVEDALRKEVTAEELKTRAKKRQDNGNIWCIVSKVGGGVIFTEDPEDIKYIEEAVVPKVDKDAKEIRGTIGNPGTYTGPARIIMNTPDFGKMQAGDVLVSTMTTPDFIVLMQKSGAIVTDIGGLLCHAAIVSREMNKPCVIGTKFATQMLKDGDMVEVDANKGIVRIIS